MSIVRSAKDIAGRIFPMLRDYSRIRAGYRGTFNRTPNVIFPKTFNEKVQRRKLFERDPRYPERADKILVKEFVDQKLGPGWTTPTLWDGPELPPVEQRRWPMPYVLKANHGSVMNVFVRNEEERDWPKIEALCQKWLNEAYGDWGGEWVYWTIKRQLLVEPFIGALAALPVDYKLWTFNGRVEFIQVDTDREKNHKRVMVDRDWKPMPFTFGPYPVDHNIPRPSSLDKMIEAARILSEDIGFVRIDFYEIEGSPRFGEMTFYPESGWVRFEPHEYDREVGELW